MLQNMHNCSSRILESYKTRTENLTYNKKMRKDQVILGLTVIATIFALAYVSTDNSSNLTVGKVPDTVPHVDIQSYLGTWYEQAVIPFYFERGCSKTKAVYSLNKDKTIRVDNSCVRNG